MKIYVYIVLLLVGLSACSEFSRQYARYGEFPEEKALNAQAVPLDTALFRYPFKIAVKGDIAIILDLHNPDYFFHVFSIPKWDFITSFGKRGKGPQEMLSADCFRFISTDSIWTLDSNKMCMTRWNYESNTHKVVLKESINLDKRL